MVWELDLLSQVNTLEQFTTIFSNRSNLFCDIFSSIISGLLSVVFSDMWVIIQVTMFWFSHQEEIKAKTQTSKENHSSWLQITSKYVLFDVFWSLYLLEVEPFCSVMLAEPIVLLISRDKGGSQTMETRIISQVSWEIWNRGIQGRNKHIAILVGIDDLLSVRYNR